MARLDPDGGTTDYIHEATEGPSEAIPSPGNGHGPPSLLRYEITLVDGIRISCNDCGELIVHLPPVHHHYH